MDIQDIYETFKGKGWLKDDVKLDCFLGDDDIMRIFDIPKFRKPRRKSPPANERQGVYEEEKCHARIWAEGYDSIQCGFSQVNGCFCKRHQLCAKGEWWLGNINEKRPEKPVLYSEAYPDGLEHNWRDTKMMDEKDETTKEKESTDAPKRRGRPKGSKNKKKKPNNKKEKQEISMAELEALIQKKQEEG